MDIFSCSCIRIFWLVNSISRGAALLSNVVPVRTGFTMPTETCGVSAIEVCRKMFAFRYFDTFAYRMTGESNLYKEISRFHSSIKRKRIADVLPKYFVAPATFC